VLEAERESAAASDVASAAPVPVSTSSGLPAPVNGAALIGISRPLALEGLRIPSKSRNVRDLVVRVYEDNGHLQRADAWAVTRYATLSWKFRRLPSTLTGARAIGA
jgi:hypothetical protein